MVFATLVTSGGWIDTRDERLKNSGYKGLVERKAKDGQRTDAVTSTVYRTDAVTSTLTWAILGSVPAVDMGDIRGHGHGEMISSKVQHTRIV